LCGAASWQSPFNGAKQCCQFAASAFCRRRQCIATVVIGNASFGLYERKQCSKLGQQRSSPTISNTSSLFLDALASTSANIGLSWHLLKKKKKKLHQNTY
jgi:hypothetical protein